ncbi:MAG: ATP-binding protein [bacterium]
MNTNLVVFFLSVLSFGSMIIGIAAYFAARKNFANVSFAVIAVSAGLWEGLSILRFYLHTTFQYHTTAFYLTKLPVAVIATAFFSIFLFAFSFPQGELVLKKKFLAVITLLYVGVVVSVFIPGAVVINEICSEGGGMRSFEPIVTWGHLYYYFFTPFLFICFFIGIGKLVHRYLQETDKERKSQFFFILIGLGVSGGLGLSIWFLMPLIPALADYFWFARFSLFIFVGFTGYAILRHKFFSLKTAAAEFFTFVILIFLLAQTVSSVGDWREFAINSGLFIFVAFFGSLLVNSVKKEVEHRHTLETLTDQLTSANERLEELDAIKSQFLSFASHQVKTPMTIIKGYVSILQDEIDTLSDVEIKDMSGKIRIATDRTISLVNNLLDLRKIEEGKMAYHMEPTNIVSIVKETTEDLMLMAENRKLSLTVDLPDDVILATVDVQKIRQVFQNLIENALKYTKEGWVKVALRRESEKSILFSVHDSGLGISSETLSGLFIEFRRGSAVVKAIKGTGIGLYIAKDVVTAHHGEVWAESEGEGKGSAFFVRLPTTETVQKDIVEN